jgi:xanthine dehydrogenase molybdopterin-binding subunit B
MDSLPEATTVEFIDDQSESLHHEWTTVTSRKRKSLSKCTSQPSVKRKISARSTIQEEDICSEQHEECMLSTEKVCLIKLRKRIPCVYEERNTGSCPFKSKCWYQHDMHNIDVP